MTARKTPAKPGPKPEFLLIEDNLHYVGPKSGVEVAVTVDPPMEYLEEILVGIHADKGESEQFLFILRLLGEDKINAVRKLRTSEFGRLLNRYMEELQKNLGATLGELPGSSD